MITSYEEIKSEFLKCKTHLKRINFALKCLNQVGVDNSITKLFSKSNKKSLKMRNSGNVFFKKGNYFEALECYTTSIAFAESEKFISLGYGNRSAVLAKLGLYTECLTDITRAFESGYPDDLKIKLVSRHERVMKLVKPKNEVKNKPEATGCLEIQENEKYGRHMVAARDMEIGEVLLVEEPMGATLTKDFAFYCHECLVLCYNPIPCSYCSKLLFCSEKCQEEAFDNYHKYECPILGYLDRDFTLAVKITLAAIIEKEKSGDLRRYHHIFSLETHENHDARQEALYTKALVAASIFKLFKKKTTFFTEFTESQDDFKELLLQSFLAVHVNGVIISRLEPREPGLAEVPYGGGIYIQYSFFNHSCFPNAFFYHDGSTLIVRALSTIKKGEQCFISYGTSYSAVPKLERQEQLLRDFHFNCTCKACEEDWPMDELSEEFDIPLMCVTHAQMRRDHDLLQSLALTFIPRLKQLEQHAPVKNLGTLRQLVVDCFQVYQIVRKDDENNNGDN